jgi:hypothetical protein
MGHCLIHIHRTFTDFVMPLSGSKLLAWIEQGDGDQFVAAYLGSGARQRLPAMRICATSEDARQWVEAEAGALGVAVEWMLKRLP